MLFHHQGYLVGAHAKCGISSFNHALGDKKISLRDAKKLSDSGKIENIILTSRSPYDRLLSAWRMYYVQKPNHIQNIDLVENTKLKHEVYFENPVYAFDHWCKQHHVKMFIKRKDPHFTTQDFMYRSWIHGYKHNIVLCSNIDSIFEYLGVPTTHQNRGHWPWQDLTLQDFNVPSVEKIVSTYYINDLHIYGKSYKNMAQQ